MNAFDSAAFDSVAFDTGPASVLSLDYRISGGKRIAAYTIDNNGRLRKEIDALVELERKQDEADRELIDALLAYWNR